MHPSTKRLHEVAAQFGHTSPKQIAMALNQSEQTVSNWKTRGVSKDGAIEAEKIYGCSSSYVLSGIKTEAFKRGASIPSLPESLTAGFDYLDAKAACGSGYINNDKPAQIARIETSLEFAQDLIGSVNKSGHVKLFRAYSDSMEPTIKPEDLLFVDTECKEMRGEGIYLILHGGGLSCKRLFKVGRKVRVCSDNKLHRDKDWDWDDRDETSVIVGKVLASMPINVVRHG